MGTRRASWRIISSIEQKEESKGGDKHVSTIRDYRQKIETELEQVCQDVLEVLDQSLIPNAESGESKVFYHKMYVCRVIFRNINCSHFILGKVIIIVILQSLPVERSARLLQPLPMKHTRYN